MTADFASSDREKLPELRIALGELAAAAQWAAKQANPRIAITGYSWFNVALEELDRLVPDRESVEEQVARAFSSVSNSDEGQASK